MWGRGCIILLPLVWSVVANEMCVWIVSKFLKDLKNCTICGTDTRRLLSL